MPYHHCEHCGCPVQRAGLCSDCGALRCRECAQTLCECDDRPQLLQHMLIHDVMDDSTLIVRTGDIWAWGAAAMIACGSPEAMRALKRLYGYKHSPLGTLRWVIR